MLLLGTFGFLETITLPDMMASVAGQPLLGVFGAERAVELNLWAQTFWFGGLVCGTLSTCLKIRRLRRLSSATKDAKDDAGAAPSSGDEKRKEKDDEKDGERRRREEKEKEEKREEEERARRVRKLTRKAAADSMDLVIPATTVGWVSVEPGLVAVVMLVTSWLTGMDVWEKYGDQLAVKRE